MDTYLKVHSFTCAIGSINSYYLHIIGDGKLNPIVDYKDSLFSRLDDHPQYKELIDPGSHVFVFEATKFGHMIIVWLVERL